ncbi:MAG: WG repeat-containing protein [Fluviicola sp.]|nr:WG repeat-containing protein [Fluviicola sp.]
MKKIILLASLFIGTVGFAQTLVASFKPVDSKTNWGYMNEKGEAIIEPSYKTVVDFNSDGVTPVFDAATKTWKFINLNNETIDVPFKKFEPYSIFGFGKTSFVDGLALVVVKKKKGVVNLKGEVVFDPIYDFISPFENGFATAKIGLSFYILSKNGERTELEQGITVIRKFSEGFAPFKAKNELFGYLNYKGEAIIEPKFMKVGHFINGIAWARNYNKQIGFIDTKGDWVVDAKYLGAKDMSREEGIARVKTAEGWKFVAKDGSEISASGAISYGDFHNGLAFARQGKMYGYINPEGEWIIKPKYLKVKDFHDGVAAVRTTDKWGFINIEGEIIFKEEARAIRNFQNGYAAVQNMQDLWGFINTKGEWVIEPQFTRVRDFFLVK